MTTTTTELFVLLNNCLVVQGSGFNTIISHYTTRQFRNQKRPVVRKGGAEGRPGSVSGSTTNLSINKLTYESSTINLKPKNFNVTFFYFNNIIRKVSLGGGAARPISPPSERFRGGDATPWPFKGVSTPLNLERWGEPNMGIRNKTWTRKILKSIFYVFL